MSTIAMNCVLSREHHESIPAHSSHRGLARVSWHLVIADKGGCNHNVPMEEIFLTMRSIVSAGLSCKNDTPQFLTFSTLFLNYFCLSACRKSRKTSKPREIFSAGDSQAATTHFVPTKLFFSTFSEGLQICGNLL